MNIKKVVTMVPGIRYSGISLKTLLCATGILLLTIATPAAALSVSESHSGYYHGVSYGYSVNLQSATTHPVTGISESQGISVIYFSPATAGSGYRGKYLPVNPVSTEAFFKKLDYEYTGGRDLSIPVPPVYLQPVLDSENIHIQTYVDYFDAFNHRIYSES